MLNIPRSIEVEPGNNPLADLRGPAPPSVAGENMRRPSAVIAALPLVALLMTASGCSGLKERRFLNDGNKFFNDKNYEAAIAQYEGLIRLDPASWQGNYLMASSYFALYHPGSLNPKDVEYAEKGLAAFERALKLTPTAEEGAKAEKLYLEFMDATGDKSKAIAYLEHQLLLKPNDLALIHQIAKRSLNNGDFSKAAEYFEKEAKLAPQNKEAWYALGVTCYNWLQPAAKGQVMPQAVREQIVDRGITALEAALKIDPSYADALTYGNRIYLEKARALLTVGKNSEASDANAKANEYQRRADSVGKNQMANARPS